MMKLEVLEQLMAELHSLDGTDLEVKLCLDTKTFLLLKRSLEKEFVYLDQAVDKSYADINRDFADMKVVTQFGQLIMERRMSDKEVEEQERYLQKHQDRLIREGKVRGFDV